MTRTQRQMLISLLAPCGGRIVRVLPDGRVTMRFSHYRGAWRFTEMAAAAVRRYVPWVDNGRMDGTAITIRADAPTLAALLATVEVPEETEQQLVICRGIDGQDGIGAYQVTGDPEAAAELADPTTPRERRELLECRPTVQMVADVYRLDSRTAGTSWHVARWGGSLQVSEYATEEAAHAAFCQAVGLAALD